VGGRGLKSLVQSGHLGTEAVMKKLFVGILIIFFPTNIWAGYYSKLFTQPEKRFGLGLLIEPAKIGGLNQAGAFPAIASSPAVRFHTETGIITCLAITADGVYGFPATFKGGNNAEIVTQENELILKGKLYIYRGWVSPFIDYGGSYKLIQAEFKNSKKEILTGNYSGWTDSVGAGLEIKIYRGLRVKLGYEINLMKSIEIRVPNSNTTFGYWNMNYNVGFKYAF
jgi:hypothetical protein